MAKKKIILLTILFSMLTACAQAPAESTTVSLLQTPKIFPSQTPSPSPVLTNTFFPTPTASATPTPFIGQVSIEHAQIIYYDITGSTENELRKSMDMLRPKDPYDSNKPVDAYTDWYILWN